MIKEITDIEIINNYLANFNTSINNIGVFSHYCVYELEGKIVGFINYDLIYDRLELIYIFVEENYRRLKIASKLLDYMINIGKDNECINITLEVRVGNIGAISFYSANGFKEVAKRENYYNNEDGLLMIRELK